MDQVFKDPNNIRRTPADVGATYISDERAAELGWIPVFPDYQSPMPTQTTTDKLAAIRTKRDTLLADCDFTQLPDAPLTADKKSAWASYRQALRDMPEKCTNLDNPTWPSPPEG